MDYASKGVAGTGLGLGIAGTALGALDMLGGLLGMARKPETEDDIDNLVAYIKGAK